MLDSSQINLKWKTLQNELVLLFLFTLLSTDEGDNSDDIKRVKDSQYNEEQA